MTDDAKSPPFNFKVEGDSVSSDYSGDVLEEFVKEQLRGLLDIVVLTANGEPVEVDGYIWMRDAFKRESEENSSGISISISEPKEN